MSTAEEECVSALRRGLGISKTRAKVFSRSLSDAAAAQAFEQVSDDGPVPSSLTAHRAGLMLRVCMNEKRILSAREVGVLLRISQTAANAVRREMLATYEGRLESYMSTFALEGSSWGFYENQSGDNARKLTLASTDQASALENQLACNGDWNGCNRSGRTIYFPNVYDFDASVVEPQ